MSTVTISLCAWAMPGRAVASSSHCLAERWTLTPGGHSKAGGKLSPTTGSSLFQPLSLKDSPRRQAEGSWCGLSFHAVSQVFALLIIYLVFSCREQFFISGSADVSVVASSPLCSWAPDVSSGEARRRACWAASLWCHWWLRPVLSLHFLRFKVHLLS